MSGPTQRWTSLVRMATSLPSFLREELTEDRAVELVRERHETRNERFLSVLRSAVFAHPSSPYLPLLRHAGADLESIRRRVGSDGIEATLEWLRERGVFVSLDEWKGRRPIERDAVRLACVPGDFDNPGVGAGSITGATSGTRGPRVRVGYDWPLIREHAATELLLCGIHGVARLPLILWLPPLPSISGPQHVLMNLTWRRSPSRWFTPAAGSGLPWWSNERLANVALRAGVRVLGHPLPRPEPVDLSRADVVAQALAAQRPALLRTYTSSAVRVAEAARGAGLDLSGCTALTGGEPLTDRRRTAIEASGMAAFPRYSSAEAGLMGAACTRRRGTDDMHLYTDRLAAIQHDGALLFTSLSPHSGKVLLNVDLGDRGELEDVACDCAFGRLGLTTRVRHVHSGAKITAEGMNLLVADLERVVADCLAAHGVGTEDWQIQSCSDGETVQRVALIVAPDGGVLDEEGILSEILSGVARLGSGGLLAADLWRSGRTLSLERRAPHRTAAHKQPAYVSDGGPAGAGAWNEVERGSRRIEPGSV